MKDVDAVRQYLLGLQGRLGDALEEIDGGACFDRRTVDRGSHGHARPWGLESGEVLERAAVHFSHSRGARMPEAATGSRPSLVGKSFEAVSLSVIVHPRNPYAPTTHVNLRLFLVDAGGRNECWWFGGGFDLTPFYGFAEDVLHWHRTAKRACEPFGEGLYERLKVEADRYFYLPHRKEARGVGGIFFDDYSEAGFERAFAFVRSVGEHFLPAYLPILERRKSMPWGDRERLFQEIRRGRYVEFNLLWDRGTRFGIQAGGPAESILASLPPHVAWRSEWKPEAGSPEERLLTDFLPPRDWLAESS